MRSPALRFCLTRLCWRVAHLAFYRALFVGVALLALASARTMPASTAESANPSSTSANNDKTVDPSKELPLIESPDAQHLLEKIAELETRISELEAKQPNSTAETAPTAPAAEPDPSAAKAEPAAPDPPSPMGQSVEPNLGVKLRMFGDMGYRISNQHLDTNTFRVGSLDLFMNGKLSDRVSVLGEVLFIPQSTNDFSFDVERLLVTYKQNDYFSFGLGRFHTSIGYYNTAFHQGAFFETAVDRPFMYAFDDQGGVLPLQEVGVTMNGRLPSGSVGLQYVVEVGNGRSHLLGQNPAQNFQDTNNGKSVNFALSARPSFVPGLQTGFSIYHDYLTFSDNINHPELISTAYVVYNTSNWEFLNEGMIVRHTMGSAGGAGVFHTPGFYTLFSHRFGKYRPYFRYSYINASVNDPIYGDPTDGTVVGRRNGPSFGLRFDMNEHSAAKLQYDHLSQRGISSFDALESQISFAF